VEPQSEAASAKLLAKSCSARVSKAKLSITHRSGIRWDVHEQLHAVDPAALHTLTDLRARIQRIPDDQEVAVCV
jgi:hypothetical protein